jgi:hypothetical protein
MVGEQEVAGRAETQILEFDNFVPEVLFDLQGIQLEGVYGDELSAYRAKKTWMRALETSFLLDLNQDFSLTVSRDEAGHFCVVCEFQSACGRYAFWRLTHNQAPEMQYIIKTAHIPQSELAKIDANQCFIGPVNILEKLKTYVLSKFQ